MTTTITGSKPAEEVDAYERKQSALVTMTPAQLSAWVDNANTAQLKTAMKLLLMGHRELVKKGVI